MAVACSLSSRYAAVIAILTRQGYQAFGLTAYVCLRGGSEEPHASEPVD